MVRLLAGPLAATGPACTPAKRFKHRRSAGLQPGSVRCACLGVQLGTAGGRRGASEQRRLCRTTSSADSTLDESSSSGGMLRSMDSLDSSGSLVRRTTQLTVDTYKVGLAWPAGPLRGGGGGELAARPCLLPARTLGCARWRAAWCLT